MERSREKMKKEVVWRICAMLRKGKKESKERERDEEKKFEKKKEEGGKLD